MTTLAIDDTHRYGCHNKPFAKAGYYAQDGWNADGTRRMTWIAHTMSRDCAHVRNGFAAKDNSCTGCWRLRESVPVIHVTFENRAPTEVTPDILASVKKHIARDAVAAMTLIRAQEQFRRMRDLLEVVSTRFGAMEMRKLLMRESVGPRVEWIKPIHYGAVTQACEDLLDAADQLKF